MNPATAVLQARAEFHLKHGNWATLTGVAQPHHRSEERDHEIPRADTLERLLRVCRILDVLGQPAATSGYEAPHGQRRGLASRRGTSSSRWPTSTTSSA